MAKLGTTLARVLRLWIPKPFLFLIFCHLPLQGRDEVNISFREIGLAGCRVLHGQG
jgi:hypothetical protein